jgi:hypothetical protein
LFYQFNYSTHGLSEPLIEFFFIPECELPDSFYQTLEREVSFEIPNLQRFRFRMDGAGGWVQKMLAIIEAYPNPRSITPRPLRQVKDVRSLPAQESPPQAPLDSADHAVHSRQRYSSVVANSCQRFYREILTLCAKR